MKNISYIIILLFSLTTASAQVTIQYGTRPVWAPNAPATVKYYYLPDIETYYDVPARRYIYMNNGTWVRTAALPAYYRGYDLRGGRTVYLSDYRGNTPYVLFKEHKVKYKGNGKWKPNGRDNGLHKGHYKDKGKKK